MAIFGYADSVLQNSLTGAQHVSLVIGLASCSSGSGCPADAYSGLGKPLYVGGFDPQYHESALPPYQNFVSFPLTVRLG